MELVVLGNEVTDYRTYIKIPDDWSRKQEELTVPRMIFTIAIPLLVLGGLAITALIIFLKNLRSPEARSIPWRRLSLWSLWGLGAYVLVFALGNRIPAFLGQYNTAIPFKVMLATLGIGALLGGPFYFGGLALVFGMAWYFAKRAFAEESFPSWSGMPPPYYRDALFIGLGGAAALVGLQTILQTISQHWPTPHRSAPASFGSDFDAYVPVASVLGSSILHSLLFTGGVALVASFIASQLRAPWMRTLTFLLATLALMPGNWGSAADFAKQWIAELILLSVLVFGVRYVMRFNVLGCFLVVALTALVSAGEELVRQPDRFYRLNGYAVGGALVVLLAWPFFKWGAPRGNGVETQPANRA
jgi:Ca2+/Na+ antiporter